MALCRWRPRDAECLSLHDRTWAGESDESPHRPLVIGTSKITLRVRTATVKGHRAKRSILASRPIASAFVAVGLISGIARGATERTIGTPWGAGSTRPGVFLRDCIAGIDGLDIAVIGDSNTGSALVGMWGYHNGICEALCALGGTPYGTALFPTVLRGASAATGGWRSSAYLPQDDGHVLRDGSAIVGETQWSSWNCFGPLMRYGRTDPPTTDGWALVQSGSYGNSFNAVYLDQTHPMNAAGTALRLRVRFGEFAYGSGWFRPAIFDDHGIVATGAVQQTNSLVPISRANEVEFLATNSEIRASWSGAGAAGPVAVSLHSLYRPALGWSVTSHAYMSGATPTQVSASIRAAGSGYRSELLREHRERQRAAGGTGRVLLWIQFGINGVLSAENWRTAVNRIMQEYRETWLALGYPIEDLAAIAFVGVQSNAADTTNGGMPLEPVRTAARAAGYFVPGLLVVHTPAVISYRELTGPPSLYQGFPGNTVHLSGGIGTTTDGYQIVSRRIIEGAIALSDCPADVNQDGSVDGIDLSTLLGGWGHSSWQAGADLNGDGEVDGRDLGEIFGTWGACE